MHILILSQYFWPESIGASIWIKQLAEDLAIKGHKVSVLTGFPNYPNGVIFEGYKEKIFMREYFNNIHIFRTYIYASPKKSILSKMLSFSSFSISAIAGGLLISKPDVIYCIIPPLPLGITAQVLSFFKKVPVVINVQDIYPDIAISLGIIRNSIIIKFAKWLERFIYKHSNAIVVISDGFKQNLLDKGILASKIYVVPNWADPNVIQPGPKDNFFRRQLNVDSKFLVIYSGSLSYNTSLESLIEAAEILKNEEFMFVIIGDGVLKDSLEQMVKEKKLKNVIFLPFQPLEIYPYVLTSADINVVTLNPKASLSSVPSKVYKIMASGTPILAIAPDDSEICRLITSSNCGLCVSPNDPIKIADALRYAMRNQHEIKKLGINGRRYLEEYFSRQKNTSEIEKILNRVVNNETSSENN